MPYCWLNLGSAGRHEQTLRTDQDNAIVYANPPLEQAQAIQDYFLRLGHKVVEGLARCGFLKCKGGVMASTPDWCRPLSGWKNTLEQWIRRLDPAEVRSLTIFLDFRPVYGERALAKTLWEYFVQYFNISSPASHLLATDELKFRPPLGFRNNIVTEKSGPHKNEINLKSSAAIHIVNCIRIFALNHGITETSTLGRLRELVEQRIIDKDDAEYIQSAYETIMMFRIRENLRKYQLELPPDNFINPNRLSKRERAILKDSLSIILRLQKTTEKNFPTFGDFKGSAYVADPLTLPSWPVNCHAAPASIANPIPVVEDSVPPSPPAKSFLGQQDIPSIVQTPTWFF
ncbi:hypothetical protein N752_28610 [Desulforamulus aquiferis]|nr:putative nucleotidyltransferase substrate binding domain-containing protein [Desulforamulus aquiferis]RYD01817.1 hypothetical protein N752_28610 [Desulforamulus aquiferis]